MKRVLSFLLAVTFVLGCFSFTAFAADEAPAASQSEAPQYTSVEFSDPVRTGKSGAYPRLAKVANGSLLMAYECSWKETETDEDTGEETTVEYHGIKIARSADNGKTWPTERVAYKTADNADKVANPAPYYDAEKNVLYLSFRNPYEPADGSHTANIRYITSTNSGDTWSEPVTVASSYVTNQDVYGGMWEPTIYRIGGKLRIYYSSDVSKESDGQVKINVGGASESVDSSYPFVVGKGYQNIVMHELDETTGLWSGASAVYRGEDHYPYGTNKGYSSRPGMQSIAQLNDGTYVMAIETSKHEFASKYDGTRYPFVVDIAFSSDGVNWSNTTTVATPDKAEYYNAAPWVDTLPDGRIIVSFQSDEHMPEKKASGESTNQRMQLKVIVSKEAVSSDDGGKLSAADFDTYYPFAKENVGGITYNAWNGVYVDGYKVYAVGRLSSLDPDQVKGLGIIMSTYDCAPDKDIPAGYTPIYTANDIVKLMHRQNGFVWTGDYILMNDIDLADATIGLALRPIGASNVTGDNFRGTFDGNGHTITLNLSGSEKYFGLFGYVLHSTIKDLSIAGSVTSTYAGAADRGNNGCAAFAGFVNGKTVISNCTNYADVTAQQTAGGFVGYALRNGSKDGAILLENCTNYGHIKTLATTDAGAAGGMMGSLFVDADDIIFRSCLNLGIIEGRKYIGGIIGGANGNTNGNFSVIDRCTNDGHIITTAADCGGLAGLSFYTKITDSINRGTVTNNRTTSGGQQTGGIVGRVHTGTVIERCINDATVYSNGGAIFGATTSATVTYTLTNCYYSEKYTATNTAGTVLKESQVAFPASYTGLDFDRVFTMAGGLPAIIGFEDKIYSDSSFTVLDSADDILALMNEEGPFTGNYVLACDVDLSKYTGELTQKCIGPEAATAFKGIFEGNGHTISGINITNTAKTGFFGYLSGATIRNLTLDGTVSSTTAYTGMLAGVANGLTTIENCTAKGSVSGTQQVGGFIGFALLNGGAPKLRVINSVNRASVTATSIKVGGFIGNMELQLASASALISACENYGNVKTTSTITNNTTGIGGIVGYIKNYVEKTIDGVKERTYGLGAQVVACVNHGVIETNGTRVAGIVGGVMEDKTGLTLVSDCVNYGTVKTASNDAGGILAVAKAVNVKNCVNYGLIEGTGTAVCSIVARKWSSSAYPDAVIENCYDLSGGGLKTVNNPDETFTGNYTVTNVVAVTEGLNTLDTFVGLNNNLWYATENGPILRNSHDECTHKYEVFIDPSYEEDGEGGYVCTICGKIESTVVIEKYAPMLGDVDGDRIVANADVTLIIRVLSGWDDGYVSVNIDVNEDKKTNNRDAIALIQKVAGWDA